MGSVAAPSPNVAELALDGADKDGHPNATGPATEDPGKEQGPSVAELPADGPGEEHAQAKGAAPPVPFSLRSSTGFLHECDHGVNLVRFPLECIRVSRCWYLCAPGPAVVS